MTNRRRTAPFMAAACDPAMLWSPLRTVWCATQSGADQSLVRIPWNAGNLQGNL